MPRLVRFSALCLYSLALAAPALGVWLAARALGGAGPLRAAARLQGLWARGMLRCLGVESVLEGELAQGPRLIVANHLSYLDVLVLGALLPGRFVAKSEIAGWPVLGVLARLVGTIFVVQARRRDVVRVDRAMARTLAAGVSVLLFPEGHSTRGAGVDRFHSSLLESAARSGTACLAVALHYETPRSPWAPASTVCWWGGMGFWRHAWDLAGLGGVRARVRPAPAPRQGQDRKRLARELQADLLERFVPVRQEPIAPDGPWRELFRATPAPPGPGAGTGEARGDRSLSLPK